MNNIEETLKKLKKDYQAVQPPVSLVEKGFDDLRLRLDKKTHQSFFWSRPLIFAVTMVFFLSASLFGLVAAAQGALPKEPLYPIKRISENIILGITGNKQKRVERRAQEIINAAKRKDDSKVLEAVKEYKQTVAETKQKIEKSGKDEGFRKKLEEQEEEFKKAGNVSHKEHLEDAIKAAEEARKENNDKQEKEGKENENRSHSD